MIRCHHYRCECGHLEGDHYECDPLSECCGAPRLGGHDSDICSSCRDHSGFTCKDGEAFHVHCAKCQDCPDFRLDEQHEHDMYEQAQERKYDEWKDRRDEGDE